jgi:exopolyphosphatase/guanosine-5'-triphosphate,3'-diphosphate pyrophosphatase
VASINTGRLQALADESAFLGLGEAVDARSHLGPDLIDTLAVTIAGFAERARSFGSTETAFFGTDPLRRAADAATAVHAVWQRSGVALNVLTQPEEAMLTLLGVMEGLPVADSTVVVDVGGGSTEFVVALPDGSTAISGIPLGATRLTRQIVRHDPPTPVEVGELRQIARDLVAGAPDMPAGALVLVGGTATNLLRVAGGASPAERLTSERIAGALEILSQTAADEVVASYGVRPERARLLPAGAAIVAAILERFGHTGARVSAAGVREGAVRALALAGAGWRDALPKLARSPR